MVYHVYMARAGRHPKQQQNLLPHWLMMDLHGESMDKNLSTIPITQG